MPKNCDQCPCLNNDADYGRTCNLGYKIKEAFFGASSEECKLIEVKFVNSDGKVEQFTPEEE